MERMVTEKYDCEYRDESVITLFIFCDYRDFNAKNKLNEFSSKSCSPSIDFSVETLMKKIKVVVTEKMSLNIKYRDISLLIGFLGLYGF